MFKGIQSKKSHIHSLVGQKVSLAVTACIVKERLHCTVAMRDVLDGNENLEVSHSY